MVLSRRGYEHRTQRTGSGAGAARTSVHPYADDCNIYVRSRRTGEPVMSSVRRLLTTKLKLGVNGSKECGGSTMGTEIPGIQLHESQATEEAPRAENCGAVQGASPGTNAADPGHKPRRNGP